MSEATTQGSVRGGGHTLPSPGLGPHEEETEASRSSMPWSRQSAKNTGGRPGSAPEAQQTGEKERGTLPGPSGGRSGADTGSWRPEAPSRQEQGWGFCPAPLRPRPVEAMLWVTLH